MNNNDQDSDEKPEDWGQSADEKDVSELYKIKELEKDHKRKSMALACLMAGFFISVCLDLGLIAFSKERWTTEIYVTSIVPILAFILGTTTKNNK
ncbi:MAG: hypothetical protein NMNS01_11220 [Nitrosomonas sp.]|nr:MAG: hypothetical protein NMNS01_11220 [Nitrosomonas sp.]